jgi:hypothetical protein
VWSKRSHLRHNIGRLKPWRIQIAPLLLLMSCCWRQSIPAEGVPIEVLDQIVESKPAV